MTAVGLVAVVFAAGTLIERAYLRGASRELRQFLYVARGGLSALVVVGLGAAAVHRRTREARAAEAKVWEILEAAPAGVALLDAAGRFTFVNRRAEALFGYPHDELIGLPLEVLVPEPPRPPDGGQAAPRPQETPAASPGPWVEAVGRNKNGGEIPLEVNVSKVDWSGGVAATCVFRDLTARKRSNGSFKRPTRPSGSPTTGSEASWRGAET